MPSQLYMDCLVHEGAGTPFPANDYADLDQYQKWPDKQKADKIVAVHPASK